MHRTRDFWFCSVATLAMALGASAPAFAAPDPQDVAQVPGAAAPDAAEGEEDVIVVKGFRQSVATSIATKRNADVLVEVVTAEDIGRLPDVSIADALARLPGVTAQRTGGQASSINIRGLSQDLVSATLNGREQVATDGNRVIEFEQYPSEVVYQAQVFKSPKASQIEGGVAGKVELKTARPLDLPDRVFSVNLRGSFNDRASEQPDAPEFGYRFSFAYQDQFLNDTLGFALGYARLVQPNVATRFAGFDFQGGNTIPATAAANAGQPVLDFDNNGLADAVPFGFEAIQFGGEEVRDAVVSVVQWEPVSNFTVLVDGYYSRFNSDLFRRGVRLFNTQSVQGFDGTTGVRTGLQFLSNPVTVGNALVGGTFSQIDGAGPDAENVNQDEGRLDELFTIGGNIAWEPTSKIALSVDVSYSRADSFFNNSGVTTQVGTVGPGGLSPADFTVDFFRNGLGIATQSFTHDFTNPLTNPLQGFFIVPRADQDELFAVAGDSKIFLEAGFLDSLEFGVRFSDRTGERDVFSFSGSGSTFGSFGLNSPQVVPAEFLSVGGFSGQFGAAGQPNFLVIDIDGALDFFVGPDRVADQEFGFTLDQSFTISEQVLAGYGQANIESEVFGVPVRGNFGLRVVRTEQNSSTTLALSPSGELGDSFTQLLPSANFVFNLTPNDIIRVAGSRQISRPRFTELNGTINLGRDGSGFVSGGGGNPFLRPFLANQADITYEKYFGTDGVLVLGFFYKNLESFIIGGAQEDVNFVDLGFNLPPTPPGEPASQPVGNLFGPVNGQGGFVRGFEFNFTKQLDFLPAPFNGLGVLLNYAYADSSINLPVSNLSGNPVAIPLPGLSTHVANPQIYYEIGGFETRVSFRYRSGFVAPQFGLNEQITGFDSEAVIDWQASYAFDDDSALRGLRLLFQANNLTDSDNSSFFGVPAQTGTIQQFGRTFFLGASYSF